MCLRVSVSAVRIHPSPIQQISSLVDHSYHTSVSVLFHLITFCVCVFVDKT